jgi:hypothetical protein
MLVILVAGQLCGAVAVLLRTFGSSPRARRRFGKAAIWIGIGSVVLLIPRERTNRDPGTCRKILPADRFTAPLRIYMPR